ncbi:DUF3334 family protein [Vibrio sp.]|nr:DUF3334 family protein [Vibrio sp.]
MSTKKNSITTHDDILRILCTSVSNTLSTATGSVVSHSTKVQKITKTCLKPDFGCFVVFDGGFSGLVIFNFNSESALDVYHQYMTNMGIPEEELSTHHNSDDVGNVLGELMNQCIGHFTHQIQETLQVNITQSQPKMMALNQQVTLQVDSNLDKPQARRVSFTTQQHHNFYIEFAMDRTEFIDIFSKDTTPSSSSINDDTDSLLDELGI